MIRIQVNGTEQQLEEELTVVGLLEHLGLQTRYGAVEINKEVIPRSEHAERRIQDGDTVEVIRFVGGG